MRARRAKSALQFDRTESHDLSAAETSERSIDAEAAVDPNKESVSTKAYLLAAVALLAGAGLVYLWIRRTSVSPGNLLRCRQGFDGIADWQANIIEVSIFNALQESSRIHTFSIAEGDGLDPAIRVQ